MTNNESKRLLNPNEADLETLQTIPGIGKIMAERIIEARPFSSPDDLTKVSGISTKFLENIRPNLSFEPTSLQADEESDTDENIEKVEEVVDDLIEEDEADEPNFGSAIVPVSEDKGLVLAPGVDDQMPNGEKPEPKKSAAKKEPGPAYITRSQAMWMVFTSGLFAFVLAVALSLGLVASLNGGLRFASASQAAELSSQLESLKTESETLNGVVSGLRTRMDNLDTLSGRVTSLEETHSALQTEFDNFAENLDSFGTRLETISGDISELQTESSKYQTFLDGLAELLASLASQEDTNE